MDYSDSMIRYCSGIFRIMQDDIIALLVDDLKSIDAGLSQPGTFQVLAVVVMD